MEKTLDALVGAVLAILATVIVSEWVSAKIRAAII